MVGDAATDSGTVIIEAHSAPFHNDPPYAPLFYECIGRAMVLWGRFEWHLDANLQVTLNVARKFGCDEEMQVSLTRKTTMFRKVYRTCPALCSAVGVSVDSINSFMSEIEGVAEDRNLIIHSAVEGFKDGEPPRLILRNYSTRKGILTIRRIEPSFSELGALAGHIDRLNTRLIVLTLAVTQLQDWPAVTT
jgi:hypothetical protein